MSSQGLVRQRCFNHLEREAVAKCPSCSRFYCRECITPHDDRVICAACLKKEHIADTPSAPRTRGTWLLPVKALAAFVIAWLFFTLIAAALLKIPSNFHAGQTVDPEAIKALKEL
ncbi:MAG: hypothetical protein ACI9TH_002977 [Kiritimatiellia bacterium]|jgi:hypothetical protein